MNENRRVVVGEPLPRIKRVRAGNNFNIVVTWESGARAGKRDVIDLAPHIFAFKVFRPLRRDPKLFNGVRVGAFGSAVEWGEGDELAIPANLLEELATQAMTNEDFTKFLHRNHLTFDVAAAELGISRRQVAYYSKGKYIPRLVALACIGWEKGRFSRQSKLSGWKTTGTAHGVWAPQCASLKPERILVHG